MTDTAAMPDPLALFRKAANHVSELLAGVRQSQIADPTPCAEWDVHALINHMIGVLEFTAGGIAGNPPDIRPTDADSSHLAERDIAVLEEAHRAEADRIVRNAGEPGALERIVATPVFGDLPVSQILVGTLLDQLIHGWDLAKATGQDTTLDRELVEFAFPMLQSGFAEQGRTMGFIGPAVAVSEDASRQDRMIAYMGRQP